MMLTRRTILTGAAAFTASCATAQPDRWTPRFAAIETRLGGRIGVAALDTRDNRRIGHRSDERFAMCSTFKAPLAAAMLARADAGALRLDEQLSYTEADMLSNSATTRAHLADGRMSIEALCEAAVVYSDNTAANVLLARLGGPAAFTAYMRSIGDSVTRLDRNEPELNTNLPNDPRDTTTPRAITQSFRTLLERDGALTQSSLRLLQQWMEDCATGRERIRAGLPIMWRAGDKTGTSLNGAANDIAIAWPPSRPLIVIAVFVNAANASAEQRNTAIADCARIVVEAFA